VSDAFDRVQVHHRVPVDLDKGLVLNDNGSNPDRHEKKS